MQGLTAEGILRAWESGRRAGPLERPLYLLTATSAHDDPATLRRLPIGRRDARLLALREASLGRQVEAFVRCPACESELTLDLDLGELASSTPVTEPTTDVHDLEVAGFKAEFRLPSTTDFDGVPADLDAARLRRLLAERCLIRVTHDGAPLVAASAPELLVDAMSERMSELDPDADVTIQLTCPDCESRWAAGFDIGIFFWEETAVLAHRLLLEVDALARRYGWRETDILRMSAVRREAYLNLA